MNTKINLYLAELGLNSSEHTVRSYTNVLSRFEESLSGELESLSSNDARSYVVGLSEVGLKASSVNHHIRVLKAFFNWLDVTPNPFEKIKYLREPKRDVVTLTSTEIQAMLDAANGEQEKLMLVLLLRTGLRAFEAVSLKVSDVVRGEDGVCRIRIIGKGDKEAKIPLAADVCDMLVTYLNNRKFDSEYVITAKGHKGGITPNALSIRVKRIAKESGLPEERVKAITAHKFRATFITGIASKTNGLVAQHAARHASQATTKRYINPDQIGVEEAILNQGGI